jgi:putative hydrolase of HD superfamily
LNAENERFNRQLNFLREVDKAKQVFRNTILMDSTRRENDAEHTWHMAICAMLFCEYANDKNIDMSKLLQMIMIHDVIEIYSGDTFAYDEIARLDQNERENRAADKLFSLLPDDQEKIFRNLWNEFEAYETVEAKYAHLVDTFMPIYHNYITKGVKWKELGVTKEKVLSRNKHIQNSSTEIWNFVCWIMDDAVKKGYLPE